MLWFNPRQKANPEKKKIISIHLMLWFNSFLTVPDGILNWISIHLMLWFNYSTSFSSINCPYFNTSYVMVQRVYAYARFSSSRFQYILCYGSTLSDVEVSDAVIHFNTSYVMVQLFWLLELELS